MTLTTEERNDANGRPRQRAAVASKDDDTDDVEDVVSPGYSRRADLFFSASSASSGDNPRQDDNHYSK